MNIICDKSILNNAISPALLAVTNKNTLPALEGLLLIADKENNSLTVCGYDLEKGVRTIVSDENIVINKSGSVIINAVRFSSIIRNLPDGDISISSDENFVVSIISKKSEFNVHSLDGEVYPTLPVLKGDKKFKIKQSALRSLINGVLFSVASNNPKPVLNGVCFEISDRSIKTVSVDGNRLAYRYLESEIYIQDSLAYDGSIYQKFTVPGKTLSELCKIIKDTEEFVEVELTNKHLIVVMENIVFFSRLIEGEYIDYGKAVSQNTTLVCTIQKKEFIESVERAAVLMDEKNKTGIKLSFEKKEQEQLYMDEQESKNAILRITSETSIGRVYDEIEINMDDDDMNEFLIAFNHTYLLDALRHTEDELIQVKLESPLRSMIILPKQDKAESADTSAKDTSSDADTQTVSNVEEDLKNKYLYLVLPTRIRE